MALEFLSGTQEYFTYSFTPISGYPVSMACWAYANDASPVDQCFIQVSDVSLTASYVRLAINSGSSQVRAMIDNEAETAAQSLTGASMAQNTWTHLGGSFISGSTWAYFNGTAGTESTNVVTFPPGLDVTDIAREGDGTPGGYMNGRLFWPAIWSAELTPAEFQLLAAGMPPWMVRPESLVFFTPLSGSAVARDWISGNNGTLTGTPTAAEGPGLIQWPQVISSVGALNPVTITDVDGDETWDDGATGLVITGTGFV